jgi:inosose dehydratase
MGGFVPVALADPDAHAAGIALALKTAELMASVSSDAYVVLADDNGTVPSRTQNAGRVASEHGLSPEQWEHFVAGTHAVAEAVRGKTGLATVFHHHCGGYVETPAEVERLMHHTDPSLIGLCLDTGHCRLGGGDSVAFVREYAQRIRHVHFKDCSDAVATRVREEGLDYFQAVDAGVFCELGEGNVDFRAVLNELEAAGYDGWLVVEQDILPGRGSPLESARNNRAYLRELGL